MERDDEENGKVIPFRPPPSERRVGVRAAALWIGAAVWVLFLIVMAPRRVHSPSEPEALRALSPEIQRAAYERALADVDQLCSPPREGLSAFCRGRAQFIRALPECGPECQQRAAGLLFENAQPR